MNIKKDKFYGSDYSLKELREIERRLEKMVKRSQNAIEKTKDWRYQTTKQHQIYKELFPTVEHKLENRNKLQTIQNINMLQQIVQGKGATLKGTKEIIKNRESALLNKELPKLMSQGYTESEATKMINDTIRSKEFYDFLHSDTYNKLSKSVGKAGSPTIVAEFIKFEKSAVAYYRDLVSSEESTGEGITFKSLYVDIEED